MGVKNPALTGAGCQKFAVINRQLDLRKSKNGIAMHYFILLAITSRDKADGTENRI